MVSITHALRRIKDDLSNLLSLAAIEQVCKESGYIWRNRRLGPAATIHYFILQILYGNTACSHVPRIVGETFTASAYCQARKRLPLSVVTGLVAKINQALQSAVNKTGLWFGHRVVWLDGSGFSMPDTPALQTYFGQPGAQKLGCGFPVAHLLAAFEAAGGLLVGLIASALRTHDLSQVGRIHPELRLDDLLVGDRGFCSFAHLALILRNGLHACLRIHQKQIVNFEPHRLHAVGRKRPKGMPTSKWLRRLGPLDQVVEWFKPDQKPDWMTQEDYATLPGSIEIRELRYRVTTPGYRTREITLATTLLDADKYPAEELAELYHARWQVETNFSHIKTTTGMDILHCKSVDGVLKEMWMFVLVYNLVRMVMLEAAQRQKVDNNRISFVDALRWLKHAQHDAPLPQLLVNPHRPARIEPRAIKRRMKEFPLMKKPRAHLRQTLTDNIHIA